MRGRRDHRAELLDGHLLHVVARQTAVGPGEQVEEELALKAGGAVKRDIAVALAQRIDAALELLLAQGADGERDPGVERGGRPPL